MIGRVSRTLAPADVLLTDGRVGVVRRLAPEDAEQLHDLHAKVSDESLRLRFFSASRTAAQQYVDHVLSAPETLALVAEVDNQVVGLATAEPIRPRISEIAFLVADELRGQGLGTLLLEHLAALARDQGIRRFEADVLSENHQMLSVFSDAGFDVAKRSESGEVIIELGTTVTPALQAAVDDREFAAEARSLEPMLKPSSIALVGVRRDGTGIGAAVLRSIQAGGFRGQLSVIHPRAAEVGGLPARASLGEIEREVDLVVIAVPAPAAVTTLRDAAAAGVRAAVVISSGFEELGEEGAALHRELAAVARASGIRLVGPNCLGLLCNDPQVRLNATFNEAVPPAGGLAVASQSGGVGIVLVDLARELGLGMHTFVSLGNKADVSSNDLLAAWYDDPEVTAAMLYLESFGNARKFARFARRFAERKPLLAVVGGRSTSGQRAGASHTAAAASPAVGVQALFAQSGVISCSDAEDLAHTAMLLTQQPLPRGRRLGVISNAGGMGVLTADAAEDVDLEVVEFSASVRARIAELVHGTTGIGNPVDAGAGAEPDQLSAILEAVLDSGEVDAVVAVVVATGVTDGALTVRRLDEVRQRHPAIPVIVVPLGGLDVPDAAGLTSYRSTAAAVRSLSRVTRYAEWLAVERTAALSTDPDAVEQTRAQARDVLERATADGTWVSPDEARPLLEDYGLAVMGEVVAGADAAVAVAQRVGFPVAVKLADGDVVHKTERKLVRIGLGAADEVRRVVGEFEAEVGGPVRVLVQPMATGIEVALGLVRDPGLGPMVMVAAGGIATDVWDDRVFLLPPISHTDARHAIHALRLWPLLDGFRGAPRADVESLEQLVVDLGRLALDVPEVAELDLNPVLVGPHGSAVVDVKLRVASSDDPGPAAPRQLRRVR
jgi:acyl-CoA synthetase (NDP forming)/GNAT superfamily N-acetyltransferase